MESPQSPVLAPDAALRIRAAFEAQPYPRQLGMRLATFAPGEAELRLPFRPDLAQADGAFDPGVVATMAEQSARTAADTLLHPDRIALTVEFKVNIMAPGKGGELIARGRVVRRGKTVTVCRADLAVQQDGRETPCATGVMTLLASPR